MMNEFEAPENMKMMDSRYIYTCTYNCEKGIYDPSEISPVLKTNMFETSFDHSISFDTAFSAREFNLEDILKKIQTESPKAILAEINQNEKENILEKVFSYKLSSNVTKFAKEYEELFGKRSNFLWKWLGVVYKESGVTLSTIDTKYLDSITETKILFTMLFSILDDVSEYYKDEKLMEDLLDIFTNNFTKKISAKNKEIYFFERLYDHFIKEMKKLPRFKEFKDMFEYDMSQIANSVRYCYLMNKNPEYLNLQEMEVFGSYNMIVYLLNGIDLMVSSKFDIKELPQMRTIFWNAQQMARIGNWLSTWKREVTEDDVSSGVFAYAFSHKILKVEDLKNLEEHEIIQKIENSGMQDYFQNLWIEKFENIKNLKDSVKSVDINQYIQGLETLIKLHMASEGFK